MKRLFFLLLVLNAPVVRAQFAGWHGKPYEIVRDKNFPIVSILAHQPHVVDILRADSALNRFFCIQSAALRNHVTDTCSSPANLLREFTIDSNSQLLNVLDDIYDGNTAAFDSLVGCLRLTARFALYEGLAPKEFLHAAWRALFKGINHIVDQYGLGLKERYPDIDSVSFDVTSTAYKQKLKALLKSVSSEAGDSLFFSSSLKIAIKLMELNGRDEAARHEPLLNTLNIAAGTAQNNFFNAYVAILILGSGTADTATHLSPIGAIRCDSAVAYYRRGVAPFIIVSGGYVHPFRTRYCEAIEMKRYLIERYGIPDSAIVTEPFARHTTTNIRNANRLIFEYAMPFNVPVLVVSSPSHISSITEGKEFEDRNRRELGYLPFKAMTRLSRCTASYLPSITSLHLDSSDPLDP